MASGQTGVRARVELRPTTDTLPGARARIFVGCAGGAQVEVTGPIVGAIAHSLWHARGGESMANWADAEAALDQLLAGRPAPQSPEVKPDYKTPAKPGAGGKPVAMPASRTAPPPKKPASRR